MKERRLIDRRQRNVATPGSIDTVQTEVVGRGDVAQLCLIDAKGETSDRAEVRRESESQLTERTRRTVDDQRMPRTVETIGRAQLDRQTRAVVTGSQGLLAKKGSIGREKYLHRVNIVLHRPDQLNRHGEQTDESERLHHHPWRRADLRFI